MKTVSSQRPSLLNKLDQKAIDFLSDSEGAERAHPSTARLQRAHDDDDESDDSDHTNVDPGTDEEDIDAPRVAQWIDDMDHELQEQTDGASDSEGVDSDDNNDDHSGNEAGPSRRLRSLQDDLSTLPLGTLRSARRSLAQVQALSDTESDSEAQSEGNVSASEDDHTSLHPTKAKREESPNQPSTSCYSALYSTMHRGEDDALIALM